MPETDGMSALPPEADIKLNLSKRSANDPKWTVAKSYSWRNSMQRTATGIWRDQ